MLTIPHEVISSLDISPRQALQWVRESFCIKEQGPVFLPHKTSIVFEQGKFMNTMPCIAPSLNAMGVKIVTRYPERTRTIDGEILLYDYRTGRLLALMDAFWVTNARTGAVAALALQTFINQDFQTISLMGLGNTARAAMACILSLYAEKNFTVRLLTYKNQASRFIEEFQHHANVRFEEEEDVNRLIDGADAVISCITNAEGILAEDSCFKPGVTVIPVHTKGFQNCDLFFDKVFADDRDHVKGFRYFEQFRQFGEISLVLAGKTAGRTSAEERILSYNIGLGLHDIVFARHIYDLLVNVEGQEENPSFFHFQRPIR
ncbi:hypothetical protein [Akkermansia sp.]|uniref:hypothetical protein n=1 Tax=Akkermansia sp. TaxID=1872421 RepID=UPI0025BE5749|nr:hypothetical protein [Akkermansia sp.]MCC8148946.1 hypothetical protein [Akkermansia sp.]